MKKIITLLTFIFLATRVSASMTYQWNDRVESCYKDVSALRIKAAYEQLQNLMNSQGNNAYNLYLANYIDFYPLFFNENKNEFKVYLIQVEKRKKLLRTANSNHPMYLHALAMMDIQTALLHSKFNEYLDAGLLIRSAFKQLQRNKTIFPKFIEGDAPQSSILLAVGTIPNNLKWIAKVLGIHGSTKSADAALLKSVERKDGLYIDRLFFYVYTQQYLLGNKEAARNILQEHEKEVKSNLLLSFMYGNILLNQSQAAQAEKIFEQALRLKDGMTMPILHYELGTAYLCRWDKRCVIELEKYIEQYSGKYYMQDAKFKQAMYAYGMQDSISFEQRRKAIKSLPNSPSDADQSAYKFATKKWVSHSLLVQARFYNDGGYHSEALKNLQYFQPNDLTRLEYLYRKGKIFQDLKQIDSASIYFLKTIQVGKGSTTYYPAKSALLLANLYEEIEEYHKAASYYKICIQMKDHEAENSLEQKAKAGLQRVEKKE
jgi:tetratricopeptide (TPR) repeat protein